MGSTIINDSANDFYARYSNNTEVREAIFGPTINISGDESIHKHYAGNGEVYVSLDEEKKGKWKSFSTKHQSNGGDWLNYIMERDYISNWIEGVKALYEYAGETWQPPQYSAPERKSEPPKKKLIIPTDLKTALSEALKSSDADAAHDYMLKEGINLIEAREMGIGFVTESIASRFPDVFSEGDVGRIAFPVEMKDLTFYACRYLHEIKDESKIAKYRNTQGADKSGFAGEIYIGNQNRIFLVEGYKDAVVLNYREQQANKRNQVTYLGLGGSSLSKGQLQTLIKIVESKKPRAIVFAFDNDKAGYQGTLKSVLSLMPILSSQKQIDLLYCSHWNEISKKKIVKDPAELLNIVGYEFFLDEFATVDTWDTFLLNFLLKTRIDDQSVTKKAFNLITETLIKCQQADIDRFCKLVETSCIASENVRLLFLQSLDEERAKHLKKEYCQKVSQHQKKIDHALKYQDVDAIAQLKKEYPSEPGIGKLPSSPSSKIDQRIKQKPDKLKTFLSEEIDRAIGWIPGAMHIVAGRPANCKTSLMLWCALKQLTETSDRKIVFFSFEETIESLFVKLLLQVYGNAYQGDYDDNSAKIEFYYDRWLDGKLEKFGEGDNKLNEAIVLVRNWLNTERLILIDTLDHRYSVEELCEVIKQFKKKQQIDLFFVDYLQRLGADNFKSSGEDKNWLKIKYISKSLADCALDVKSPLIVGAQMNRESTKANSKIPTVSELRESGDIEQDAHSVLISHKVPLKENEQEGCERDYILRIGKNRRGPEYDYNGKFRGYCLGFKNLKRKYES